MTHNILAALSINWTTVISVVSLIGVLTTAYVSFRRLPGQQKIDEAQRESLVVDTATKVAADLRTDLQDCRRLRRELEEEGRHKDWELERLRRRVGKLEAALRAANIPIPTSE